MAKRMTKALTAWADRLIGDVEGPVYLGLHDAMHGPSMLPADLDGREDALAAYVTTKTGHPHVYDEAHSQIRPDVEHLDTED